MLSDSNNSNKIIKKHPLIDDRSVIFAFESLDIFCTYITFAQKTFVDTKQRRQRDYIIVHILDY